MCPYTGLWASPIGYTFLCACSFQIPGCSPAPPTGHVLRGAHPGALTLPGSRYRYYPAPPPPPFTGQGTGPQRLRPAEGAVAGKCRPALVGRDTPPEAVPSPSALEGLVAGDSPHKARVRWRQVPHRVRFRMDFPWLGAGQEEGPGPAEDASAEPGSRVPPPRFWAALLWPFPPGLRPQFPLRLPLRGPPGLLSTTAGPLLLHTGPCSSVLNHSPRLHLGTLRCCARRRTPVPTPTLTKGYPRSRPGATHAAPQAAVPCLSPGRRDSRSPVSPPPSGLGVGRACAHKAARGCARPRPARPPRWRTQTHCPGRGAWEAASSANGPGVRAREGAASAQRLLPSLRVLTTEAPSGHVVEVALALG